MLLEDERGTVNLIVPPPVYDRHRPLVRAAPLLRAKGKLERREGTINVVVTHVAALERTEEPVDAPPPGSADPLSSPARPPRREPPIGSGHEPSPRRRIRQLREHAVAELRAVAPSGHSFGRRG
jgi:error-prone DNA polymerase